MISGEKLRMLRIVKGLKQQFVADRLGITQQAYSKLERKDVISDQVLEKIMLCISCTPEEFNTLLKITGISSP
jgi:transcriptional regulator with XRE-family HTH domain